MSTTPKTHVIPTIILLAVAVLPAHPFVTNSAYGDSETSLGNIMQASAVFPTTQALRVQLSEPTEFVAQIVDDLPPPEGEVAGAEEEEPKQEEVLPEVEVSEEPIEVVAGEPVVVETSNEPLEVVEPVEPQPESAQKEEAPEPQETPAPTPTE